MKIRDMKTVYLTEQKQWLHQSGDKVGFNYEDISELKEELEKRKISIGYGSRIGDGVSIRNLTSIGDYVSIGNDVSIGYGSRIGNHVIIGNDVWIGNDVSIRSHAIIEDYTGVGHGVTLKRRSLKVQK